MSRHLRIPRAVNELHTGRTYVRDIINSLREPENLVRPPYYVALALGLSFFDVPRPQSHAALTFDIGMLHEVLRRRSSCMLAFALPTGEVVSRIA